MSEKKHAKFGSPSALYRTKNCPGWIKFCKDIPVPPSSEHAIEGTVFHDVMEDRLLGSTLVPIPSEYEDMEQYVDDTLLRVRSLQADFLANHSDVHFYYELAVQINEDIFGTADVVMVGHTQTGAIDIVVLDFKYGRGVTVNAWNNLQLIAYAIGTAKTLKLDWSCLGETTIIIAQMRTDDHWELNRMVISADGLDEYEDQILKIVALAKTIYEDDDVDLHKWLHAGAWCRWCPANGRCPAQDKKYETDALASVSALSLTEQVAKLSLDRRVEIFLTKSQIEDFLNAVAASVRSDLEAGLGDDRVKVIKTAGRRSWDAEKNIDIELEELGLTEDQIFDPPKVKAFTKIEKIIGKGKVNHLLKAGEGKTELVPADDKRPAIAFAKIEAFKE